MSGGWVELGWTELGWAEEVGWVDAPCCEWRWGPGRTLGDREQAWLVGWDAGVVGGVPC